MEFENINDSEILLIQGGGKGDIFYDLGWWLASKYKDVGGNTGMRPEAGKILARKLTVEQSKKAVDILIDWYAEHGEPRERMGKLLERLGNPLEGVEL